MQYYREAKDTLSAVEMDIGDVLDFKLRNGQVISLKLLKTAADIVETNIEKLKAGKPSGGTVYRFSCEVEADGFPMKMERYVCTQESFYSPYVINGMRIWFDSVSDVFDFISENHGECRPAKKARFAFNDLTDTICPGEIKDWYPNESNYIDISECYSGDDCWMGPYRGAAAHGGLDVNHPCGTPLWIPIDIDYQYFFNSLEQGHNNNRWRGVKRWPDGSLWIIQAHHIVKLLIREHTPAAAGVHFAEAAGVFVGKHEHSHFVFKVFEEEKEVLIDPWIIFWQLFEQKRVKAGEIRAAMKCLNADRRTGEKIRFSSTGSREGTDGTSLSFHWSFGDGSYSDEANPSHIYVKGGIYPVTLVLDDGVNKAAITQHITVNGDDIDLPCPALSAPDELSFRKRPVQMLDVYGWPVRNTPNTVKFRVSPQQRSCEIKTVYIKNIGAGVLNKASCHITYHNSIEFHNRSEWLKLESEGEGNNQRLRVGIDAGKFAIGEYKANVTVEIPGAVNSQQVFNVLLEIIPLQTQTEIVIDNKDKEFSCTPYFWVGHRFYFWDKKRGYGNFYLTNGKRSETGEFARFTPHLLEGRYLLALHEDTPFDEDTGFYIRVHSKQGDEMIWMEPSKTLEIGFFEFSEGSDGFAEIMAEGSKGQVYVDAVSFKKI